MKTIVFITKDHLIANIIDSFFKTSCNIIHFSNIQSSLDYIYGSIPDIVIMDIVRDDSTTVNILNELKGDPIFGHLPVLAVFDDDFEVSDWDSLLVDDYIKRSYLEKEMVSKVGLCVHRAERTVEVNPLTRLPGNIAINKQIQKRLDAGDIFALAYADLDYFKPYNDLYGFSRGDEVLKMLGRLVLNTVKGKQPLGSFVGHIGGDDFVFITDPENMEETASAIIDNFSKIILTFYDQQDRAKGCIESVDREGNKRTFPLIGISIGIVHNKFRKFSHYGEMAGAASEMKKYAKISGGQCLKVDKRHAEQEVSQKV